MLRSLRLGEADRVLHLYTLDRGRIGAVAKGIRKTKSRFGARLEPLSHVELMLHQGSGELQTVTGVELVRSHHAAREDPYRLGVGLVGAEAMLRLFTEQERERARVRGADALPRPARRGSSRVAGRPALDPLGALVPAQAALALRLPAAPDELRGVRRAARTLVGYSPQRGRRRLPRLRRRTRCALSPAGIAGSRQLLAQPARRGAAPSGLSDALARDALAVITARVRVPRRLPPADAAQRRDAATARERARARRRPEPRRRRRRPRLPRERLVLGRGAAAGDGRTARRARRNASSVSTTATRQVGFARAFTDGSRSSTSPTSTCFRSTAAEGSASSSSARWSRRPLRRAPVDPASRRARPLPQFGFAEPSERLMERSRPESTASKRIDL